MPRVLNLEISAGNFFVAGKITFDGDNTAILEFGGYTYTINLDTGAIS